MDFYALGVENGAENSAENDLAGRDRKGRRQVIFLGLTENTY